MNNKIVKFYGLLVFCFFALSLLAISSCTMPELSPELYIDALNIEMAGDINMNNPGQVIINPLENKGLLIIYNASDIDISITAIGAPLNPPKTVNTINRAYSEWLDPGTYIIKVSYSGGTKETQKTIRAGNDVHYVWFVGQSGDYAFGTIPNERPGIDDDIPDQPTLPGGSTFDNIGYVAIYNADTAEIINTISITGPNPAIRDTGLNYLPKSTWSSPAIAAGTAYSITVNGASFISNDIVLARKVNVHAWSKTGTPTQGGGEEGDSPGIIDDSNRHTLGLLIARNLTTGPGVAVDYFQFTNGAKYYEMRPGPGPGSEKSILLGPGNWEIVAHYTLNGIQQTTPKTKVMTLGMHYIYFYKSKSESGGYAVGTGDNISDIGSDLDTGNINDPDEIYPLGHGKLHIINSSASETVVALQYLNGVTWVNVDIQPIPASGSSKPNVNIPAGTWAFRFRILSKTSYSASLNATIRERQTSTITYTDRLDSDAPPAGYAGLQIHNISTKTVLKIKTVVPRAPSSAYNQSYPLTVSPGQTKLQLILAAPSSTTYNVQVFISSTEFIGYIVSIAEGQVKEILVEDKDTENISEDGPGNPTFGDAYHGALRVINAYPKNYVPMKIFKIIATKTANNTYPSSPQAAVWTSNDLEPRRYPWGSASDGDDFLSVGSAWTTILHEGEYNIEIVAGAYTWDYYSDAHTITYDMGTVYIAPYTRKTINFNPRGYEHDLPNGVVRIVLTNANNDGSYSPISRVQVISRNYAGPKGDKPGFGKDASKQPSVDGSSADGSDIRRYIVYEYNGSISSVAGYNTLSFYLPPGQYRMRVLSASNSTDIKNGWYGRSSARFLDFNIQGVYGEASIIYRLSTLRTQYDLDPDGTNL